MRLSSFPAIAIVCALTALANTTHAALSTDPFVYDPHFNGGVIVEDRFASTTPDTTMVGERVFVSSDGSVVASGNVAVAYQGSPTRNFGSVRYGSSGNRTAWGNPTSAFSYYYDHYFDWPNITTSNISRVDDVKEFMGYVFALVDLGGSAGNTNEYLFSYTDGGPNTNGGQLVYGHTVFNGALSNAGKALVPYTYPTFDGAGNPITAYRLIVVATSTTSSGQSFISMKRYVLDIANGQLTADTSFGTSGTGEVDQVAPNSMCNAKANCSWTAATATALRTNTDNPTLYIGGTALNRTSAVRDDGVIVSVNGYDGSLNSSFGFLTPGFYVNELTNQSNVSALAATTTGNAANDVIYVVSGEAYTNPSCAAYPATVTKLLAQTTITIPPGQTFTATAADSSFASGGTLRFGGELTGCVYSTVPIDTLLDGNRLVVAGYETDYSGSVASAPTEPLLAIVRASDGALTEYRRGALSPLHADGTPWGGGAFWSVALQSPGRYAVTGWISDASANNAALFGTAVVASDRIFGDDFESP